MKSANPRWAGIRRRLCIDHCYVKLSLALQHYTFLCICPPEQRLYAFENGCHDQTSTDLVSHSFSLLSCFGVTRCFYVEWLMLALKGLRRTSLCSPCVRVCAFACACKCCTQPISMPELDLLTWRWVIIMVRDPPHTHLYPCRWFDLWLYITVPV